MTRIEIAPDLVEEAVFLTFRRAAERGDDRATTWLEGRERFYELRDDRAREAAFHQHALTAFRALHFDEALRAALEACPHASRQLDTLFVRRARRAKEEAAELYCATASGAAARSTRAVLALKPERFADLERLFEFTHRELLYVDDMLDERFLYEPVAIDRLELDPGMRDVVRERVSRAWKQRVERRSAGEALHGTFRELVQSAAASLGAHAAVPLEDPPHTR